MYIATVPNRKSPPAILLRESYRENGKVKTRTIANLSQWAPERIEALRKALKGEFDGVDGEAVSGEIFGVIICLEAVGRPGGHDPRARALRGGPLGAVFRHYVAIAHSCHIRYLAGGLRI